MNYGDAELPVAASVAQAHHDAVSAFGRAGAWWSGLDRLRIVAETRTAAGSSELPPVAVEAIHGIRNDSGRLTRRWFDDLIDVGLQPEAYVELVALAASSVIVDTFAQGVGLEQPKLPDAQPGSPSFERSADVVEAGAWLPLKRDGRANILRSLGLVPSALKLFFDTFRPSYYMAPGAEFSISRAQVELVASRVSAANECFY